MDQNAMSLGSSWIPGKTRLLNQISIISPVGCGLRKERRPLCTSNAVLELGSPREGLKGSEKSEMINRLSSISVKRN